MAGVHTPVSGALEVGLAGGRCGRGHQLQQGLAAGRQGDAAAKADKADQQAAQARWAGLGWMRLWQGGRAGVGILGRSAPWVMGLPPLPPLLRTLPGWNQRRRALQVLAAAGLVLLLRPWWPVSLLPGWLVGLLLLWAVGELLRWSCWPRRWR